MKHIASWLIGCAAIASAQSGLDIPRVGYFADANQSVRPLIGFPGNLILGDSIGEGAVSVASSGAFTMVKTSASLAVFDRQGQLVAQQDSQDGTAMFAFNPDGSPAVALLPASGKLYGWTGAALQPLADIPALGGDVLSLAASSIDTVRLLVAKADGPWLIDLSAADGSLAAQTALPGIATPAILTPRGEVAYLALNQLVIRDPSGSERFIECGFVPAQLTTLGSGWLLLVEQDTGARFAVRTLPGAERVARIPEAAK